MKPALDDIYSDHVWRVYAFFSYRLGSREDAEDLTQATFERAGRALSRYDPERASVRTWLLVIAHNLLIDHFRRGRSGGRQQALDDAALDRLEAAAPHFDEPSVGLDRDLSAAIAALTDRDREIVALRYGGDLTGPEIAAITGLSLANVQQILSRSLRKMRVVMEEQRAQDSRNLVD